MSNETDPSPDRSAPSPTVAVVQARPHAAKDALLAQTLDLAGRAADQGARLVVFPETWLGGYPAWLDHCSDVALWDHAPTKEVFAAYRRGSITVPGPETEALGALAAERGLTLVLGVSERVDGQAGHGTLYNTLLTIGEDGAVRNHHRKLVPTYTERLIWGPGDGHGLRAVDTPLGRVGALVCWEHFMPLARHAMHREAEAIHVAVWPAVHEMHQIASRQYAFEGRCFVLAAGQVLHAEDLPTQLDCRPEPGSLVLRGGSAIIGPDGRYVVEPVFDREEILLATLDLGALDREAMTLDVTGHYDRPDVLALTVDRRRGSHRPPD